MEQAVDALEGELFRRQRHAEGRWSVSGCIAEQPAVVAHPHTDLLLGGGEPEPPPPPSFIDN